MSLFSFLARKYSPGQPSGSRSLFSFSGGTLITEDSAMQVSAFWSGVMYLSTQIAKLPWYLKDKNNEIISQDSSVISKMLSIRPNPEMTSFRFRLFMVQSAIIHGNAYAEIVRDISGRPRYLYPLKSNNVQPLRSDSGQLYYRIVGGSILNNGEDVILFPEDIFHIPNFYTKDGIVGQGVAAYATEVLGISIGADKFANSLYANGGMPSGVLEVEGSLSDDALTRLKESWAENHKGRKVGGTAVLEEGVTYKPITYQPDVMQFLESRRFSVFEIARFLRVPPTKLYDSQTSTYNNIEHSNLEVAVDTLDAWAKNFETECDAKLLNDNYGGRFSELDLYAVFRGDMETRSQYFQRMLQMSAMTPNEVRVKEGMPKYPGGDRYYIATNNYSPVDRIDEIVDSQVSSKVSEEGDDDGKKVNDAVVNYLSKRR